MLYRVKIPNLNEQFSKRRCKSDNIGSYVDPSISSLIGLCSGFLLPISEKRSSVNFQCTIISRDYNFFSQLKFSMLVFLITPK